MKTKILQPRSRVWLLAAASVSVAACLSLSEDEILTVEVTGGVAGLAYLDANGSGSLEGSDEPLQGLEVRLLFPGTQQVAASAMTGVDGTYRIADVPAGTFEVAVGEDLLGDSLEVVDLDSTRVVVALGDTASVRIGVSFPAMRITQAKALLPGRKVFVEGITLNAGQTFRDGAIHVADASGFIRTRNVTQAIIFPGDSVRFLGRTSRENGQTILDGVTAFVLEPLVGMPDPVELSTLEAAGARNGSLDAANVSVRQAVVTDTASVDDGFVMTVDDGSGPLDIFLDGQIPFDLDPLVPEALLKRVRGLLVPQAGGVEWLLKPRFPVDVEAVLPAG